ncbi:hypothetical protein [Sphingomonas rubra]|uniref:Polymer-forming protein n=1 Tax=Sphingomonas rubra TaxID=634430 RepID=A0A1I5QJX8_9SPHN|nr:hypothetical protein [Sphingomonas rubra]SFP46624.1 hypothetical protein SAMN04488241_102110 [Sphingomonas rubra]
MHNGNLTLDRSGRFDGMVNGSLTVAAGCRVEMAGMVNGALVVERDAHVVVSGMVNGATINRGGHVDVTGLVGD